MTFKEMKLEVVRRGKLPEQDDFYFSLAGSFLNEAIQEFMRVDDWEKTRQSLDIVLDGSGEYDLSTLLTDSYYFEGEIDLTQEGTVFKKYNYENYIKQTDKTGLWAILGTKLYIPGDSGTVTLIFSSPGIEYPMADDDDENEVSTYYFDVIIQWAIVLLMNNVEDWKSLEFNTNLLRMKVDSLKRKEQRVRHHGHIKQIVRN